jgi:hypothetical protein
MLNGEKSNVYVLKKNKFYVNTIFKCDFNNFFSEVAALVQLFLQKVASTNHTLIKMYLFKYLNI